MAGTTPAQTARLQGGKAALKAEIEVAYADGFRTFITVMAQGVDIWAGELVLELRALHNDVRLICALPFPGFDASWSAEWQKRYQAVLQAADLTCAITDRFSMASYQIRNEWMVLCEALHKTIYEKQIVM